MPSTGPGDDRARRGALHRTLPAQRCRPCRRDVRAGHRLGRRHAGRSPGAAAPRVVPWCLVRRLRRRAQCRAGAQTGCDWRLVLDADEWIQRRRRVAARLSPGRDSAHIGLVRVDSLIDGAAGGDAAARRAGCRACCRAACATSGRVHEQPRVRAAAAASGPAGRARRLPARADGAKAGPQSASCCMQALRPIRTMPTCSTSWARTSRCTATSPRPSPAMHARWPPPSPAQAGATTWCCAACSR